MPLPEVLIVDGERSTVRRCGCDVAGGRVVATKEADTVLIQCGTSNEWRVFYPEQGKLRSRCFQASAEPTELRMSRNTKGILTAQRWADRGKELTSNK